VQFNFWWFTSDPGTNIIIATVIWFMLSVCCQRSCSKNQKMHPVGYVGYAIASFGMAFTSVAGVYGFSIAAPFVFVGIIITLVAGRKSESVPKSTPQGVRPVIQSEPKPRPAIDGIETTCPGCGKEVIIRGTAMKPDGTAVCPICFKRFTPEQGIS